VLQEAVTLLDDGVEVAPETATEIRDALSM
jgi:hypothetical protein